MKSLRIVLITAILMILWAGQAMAQTVYLNNVTPDLTVEGLGTPVESESNSDWTKEDTARQLFLTLSQFVDWRYTLDIKNHGNVCENNPILGKYPSDQQVDTYFVVLITGNYLLNKYILLPKYRRAWQYINIGFESYCIYLCWDFNLRMQ